MEITFELEDSDIIVDFEPDFDLAVNCTDIEKVQWKFQNGNHTGVVADVFSKPQDDGDSPARILPHL
tara:strand:- start:3595 stop:3795 length:201 start_codon:yes stop_codon:yes gene_type:complete